MGKRKKTTIGYKYYMGLHMGLCRGPVDAIRQIRVGDKVAWTGTVASNTTIHIDKPDLFGGSEQEGGIVGDLTTLMGGRDQPRHAGLAAMLGGLVSAFRGVTTTFFDGLVCAMSPYPKEWSYLVQKTRAGWAGSCWYPEKCEIPMRAPARQVTGTPALAATSAAAGEEVLIAWDSKWKYQQEAAGAAGGDHSGIDVDDSAWPVGRGGFGNLAGSYLTPAANTVIFGGRIPTEAHNAVWLRCHIKRVANGRALRIKVWADDTPQLWINGAIVRLARPQPESDPFLFLADIPNTLQRADNTVALRVADGGLTDTTNPQYIYAAMELVAVKGGAGAAAGAGLDNFIAMNPAHILRRLYTDPSIGRGLDAARALDEASWIAAADALYAEGFGLCMKWSRSGSVADFAASVINHAGAAVYTSRTSGKLVLKLIRGDYDADDLPLFTPDTGLLGVDDDESSSQGVGINEIVVRYTNVLDKCEAAVREKNLGAIMAAGGTVMSEEVDYSGIPTEALARRVARRDLKAKSGFIKKLGVRLDRRGRDIMPGHVFRISDAQRGISNMVLRAGRVEFGSITDGTITVTALQDVFGLPAAVYRDPAENSYVPPAAIALPPPLQAAMEAPYRDLAQAMSAAELAALDASAGYLHAAAVRPSGLASSFKLLERVRPAAWASAADDGQWCPGGTLAQAIDCTATAIALDNASDLASIALGAAALLGSEIVRIDAVNPSAATLTIARGCLDTVPARHARGTALLCYDGWGADSRTEFAAGVTADAILLTRTGSETLAESDAVAQSVTFAGRAARPYPPADVRINGQRYPDAVTGSIALTWAHRDRITQADHVIDTSQAGIGPEPGTTYTARLLAARTGDVLAVQSGIVGCGASLQTTYAGPLMIELASERGGLPCYQTWQHTVNTQAAFDPLALYAGGVRGALIDPGDLSTVWADDAGTVPAAVDEPVALITDKSGCDVHAWQSTPALRPYLRRDASGRYYLAGDGARWMFLGKTAAQTDLPCLVLCAAQQAASASTVLVGKPHADSHTDPYFRWSLWRAGASIECRINGTPYQSGGGWGAEAAVLTIDTPAGQLIAGSTEASLPAGETLTYPHAVPARIFANASEGEIFTGRLYALAIVGKALTGSERQNLQDWMAQRMPPA